MFYSDRYVLGIRLLLDRYCDSLLIIVNLCITTKITKDNLKTNNQN